MVSTLTTVLTVLAILLGLAALFTLISTFRVLRRAGSPTALEKERQDIFGFLYDEKQNIFYSAMYAWQRERGYNKLYDEMTAPLGMNIDCEPFYFNYGGKHWLLELWKGQYGMSCGAEIGVYYADEKQSGEASELIYEAVSDEDRLQLSLSLYKKDTMIFTRSDLHWWLTGFRLFEFSKPKKLSAAVSIEFKDAEMANSFADAMEERGYDPREARLDATTLQFMYRRPRSKQPPARFWLTSELTQAVLRLLCRWMRRLTRDLNLGTELEYLRLTHPLSYKLASRFAEKDHCAAKKRHKGRRQENER